MLEPAQRLGGIPKVMNESTLGLTEDISNVSVHVCVVVSARSFGLLRTEDGSADMPSVLENHCCLPPPDPAVAPFGLSVDRPFRINGISRKPEGTP
jgi:hypothetical protein